MLAEAQSGSEPHEVRHAVVLAQTKPPAQAPVVPLAHVPEPVHVLAVVSVLPVHAAAPPHTVPDAFSSQTPPKAQLPVFPHGGAAVH